MKQAVYSVSSLVRYLKASIDQDVRVQSILIKGEISNFTNHRSGHWYFTLKDANARLSCVMFSSYASRCKLLLKEGMQVIVKASLSVYEAQGAVQLYVTSVQSDGLGDLYLEYEQLKRKLSIEGLFDEAHKRPLPRYPQHIALISAKEGAALQDMLQTLRRRWPIAKISFIPSLVQGKEASAMLCKAIEAADALHPDVILLARGGGAIEDLWCFNDEALARCVYACRSVIISGVGHESDTTLVDYVSDARAPTPTAAAELATPDMQEVRQQLAVMKRSMLAHMKRHSEAKRKQLEQLRQHRYLRNPLCYTQDAMLRLAMLSKGLEHHAYRITNLQHELKHLSMRLQHNLIKQQESAKSILSTYRRSLIQNQQRRVNEARQALCRYAGLLDAYSPLKILGRGYALVYENERMISSIHEIKENSLSIRMKDGIIHTNVIKKEEF